MKPFNEEIYRLGSLCKRGHDYDGKGHSLRSIKQGGCYTCKRTHINTKAIDLSDSLPGDKGEHNCYLGKLCVNGHDYQNTGKSLRYKKKYQCVECKYLMDKEYREENREKLAESKRLDQIKNRKRYNFLSRINYRKDIEKSREKSRLYAKNNPEKNSIIKRRYKLKNPEKIKAYDKEWRQLNKDKVCESSRRRRIRKAQVISIPYSLEDLELRLDRFNCQCAYCDVSLNSTVKNFLHWDHVVPISKGGHDAIYNLIPACISCNSAKRDRDILDWYPKQAFYKSENLDKILEILKSAERPFKGWTLSFSA